MGASSLTIPTLERRVATKVKKRGRDPGFQSLQADLSEMKRVTVEEIAQMEAKLTRQMLSPATRMNLQGTHFANQGPLCVVT